MRLEFREVTRDSWLDFAALFEERGGPKSCWCMVWRANRAEAKQRDGMSRRAQIKARVDCGTPIGLIGYFDGEPIAWCSVAPRETYRNLRGVELNEAERVWSLACMFIKRPHRGKGITQLLIRAAAEHARAHGATSLEAYPVERSSPSYRFMGFVDTFASAGFHEVGTAGERRHIVKLQL
jgi:GNAT superfamily N-acetyltransferase